MRRVPEGRSLPPAFLWCRGPPLPPSCPRGAGPHGSTAPPLLGRGVGSCASGDCLKGGLHSPWHSLGVPLQGGHSPVLQQSLFTPSRCLPLGQGQGVASDPHLRGDGVLGQGGWEVLCGRVSFISAAAWSTHCVQASARPTVCQACSMCDSADPETFRWRKLSHPRPPLP